MELHLTEVDTKIDFLLFQKSKRVWVRPEWKKRRGWGKEESMKVFPCVASFKLLEVILKIILRFFWTVKKKDGMDQKMKGLSLSCRYLPPPSRQTADPLFASCTPINWQSQRNRTKNTKSNLAAGKIRADMGLIRLVVLMSSRHCFIAQIILLFAKKSQN